MASWGFVLWLIGLSVTTFFAVAWLLDISSRQRKIQEQLEHSYVDSEGRDVSEPLRTMTERLEQNEVQIEELHAELQQVRNELEGVARHLPGNVRAVGLIRFQAFSDYGGDQSFALALADTAGDGAVISGIYAREGTRVYAKPLSSWTSSYSLSFEEEEAIDQAKNRI
jgi:hypothetical protein